MKATAMALCGIEIFRAVFDDFPGESALGAGGDVEYAGLDATGTETSPVGLCQAKHERFFGGVLRLE